MKTIKFLKPVTVQMPDSFDPYEDAEEPVLRTFNIGEVIKANITRETEHKIDFRLYGDDFYGIDKDRVSII